MSRPAVLCVDMRANWFIASCSLQTAPAFQAGLGWACQRRPGPSCRRRRAAINWWPPQQRGAPACTKGQPSALEAHPAVQAFRAASNHRQAPRRAREGSRVREPGKSTDGRGSGAGETRMCWHPRTRVRLPARNRGAPGTGRTERPGTAPAGAPGRWPCTVAPNSGPAITSAQFARYRPVQCSTAS